MMFEQNFLYPTFMCPLQTISTKIDGINSYEELFYCSAAIVQDGTNFDPSLCSKSAAKDRTPFFTCKNDCPGGKHVNISYLNISSPVQGLGVLGGGALLLAASGFSGVSTLLAAGGDRGASPDLPAGVGGAAVAGGAVVTRAMCTTPFCSAASGQCCLLIGSNRGVVCPRSC